MSIVVDLIIVVLILMSVLTAYKKGLVSLALGLVYFLIAIAITTVLYKPVSNFIINATSIDETIENVIYEKANNAIEEKSDGSTQAIDLAKKGMLPETARILAINIVTGGVIILLLVGTRIALIFAKTISNWVTSLPILKQINKAGGIAYGLLRGVLIIYIALLLIGAFSEVKPDNVLNNNIENSYIGKVMYENNILKVFFEKNK